MVEAEVEIDRWDGVVGYCRRCPGEHLHTTPNSGQPIVRLSSRAPYASCFHDSCKGVLADLNQRLAELFDNYCAGHDIKVKLTPAEKAERKFRQHLRRITAEARLRLAPKLIVDVPTIQWMEQSPFKLWDWPVKSTWAPFLAALFAPTDMIWIGSLRQSGREFKHCFRTTREWIDEMSAPPGEQVCAAPFRTETKLFAEHPQRALLDHKELRLIYQEDDPEWAARDCVGVHKLAGTALMGAYAVKGEYRRSAEFLRPAEYVILESDTLTRMQFGSVVRYLQKYTTLRSMTDTAGKGIHAIFDKPKLAPDRLRELYAVLVGLGADAQTLRRTCPTTRLPGYKRVDDEFNVMGWQRLYYLNPKHPI